MVKFGWDALTTLLRVREIYSKTEYIRGRARQIRQDDRHGSQAVSRQVPGRFQAGSRQFPGRSG